MKNLILDDFLERYGNSVYGKWNAPTDGIYIGRGSKFGNPYPMENKSDEEQMMSDKPIRRRIVIENRNRLTRYDSITCKFLLRNKTLKF